MEKLRSSFRALQEAVMSSVKPIAPVCIQKARTRSFREPADLSSCSFHGFSCTPTPSTSLSSSALSKLDDPAARWSTRGLGLATEPLGVCARDEMTTAQASSSSDEAADDLFGISESLRKSSERFFFSPHSTKSIMEEAAAAGPTTASRTASSADSSSSSWSTTSTKTAAFCDESLAVAMASDDPYYDFRASMMEMVAAHELRDWRCLQELFNCYLMLNDKRNHKVIVLAFVDLLMQLRSQDSDGFSSSPLCSSS